MRYAALAADYDGTLASNGRVAEPTLRALAELAATGRKLVLVTGRELDDLLAVFPEIDVFDRVVAENGAVLYSPKTSEHRTLGEPPPPAFIEALQRRGVAPLSVGRSIVATVEPHETIVLETIRDLGLELQVIFNKGAVMILPPSLNKATGLVVALEDLGLSPRNAAAIGDAENDHALLRIAEFGVAVANAVPTLKAEADHASLHPNGRAIVELCGGLIDHDLRNATPRLQRRSILLGNRVDGREMRMPTTAFRIVIAGPARAGVECATGALQRVAEEGYQFCVIDSEGKYEALAAVVALGAADREPTVDEVMSALHKPRANVAVNVRNLRKEGREAFFSEMMKRIQELRAATGRPHWLLVDGADEFLPRTAGAPPWPDDDEPGWIYVTTHPALLSTQVLGTVDLVVAVGESPGAALGSVAASRGVPPPTDSLDAPGAEGLAWFPRERGSAFRIHIARARNATVS
jgi:hydroxymethylpyrimidine pyrophosphatase-like HAD family hydrolase